MTHPEAARARPPLETCLFDLDGTLIDSTALILASFRHVLAVHRPGAAPTDTALIAGMGTPLEEQLGVFGDGPEEIAAMAATYRAFNREHHDEAVRPFPGVREALEALRRRGARLGVVTSKQHEGCERGLRRCGLEGLFDVLIGADDVTRHKPDPEPVLEALRRLAADAARALFAGDSPYDLRAGRAAGVRTAAVLWGPFPRAALEPYAPDLWLERPCELAALA